MTTPPPASPAPRAFLGGILSSPRALSAWALVGYAALFLVFEFFEWILPDGGSFSRRSADANFDDLFVMALPVLAVLLAVHVAPALAGARLITAIALIEFAVSIFFDALTLLLGLPAVVDGIDRPADVFGAFGYFILGLAGLALIAIAGYVAYRAYSSLGGRLPMGRLPMGRPTIGRPPAAP